MPRIEFAGLPLEIARHLRRKLRSRKLTDRQVLALIEWLVSGPEAPEGDWWKDFGSFKLCGTGRYPKTVLEPDMEPYGVELE